MAKFLDSNGLSHLWEKIKTWSTEKFVGKEPGKGLSTNDYTTAEKEKLAGLEKITVDEALSGSSANPVQNKAVHAAMGKKLDASLGQQTVWQVWMRQGRSRLHSCRHMWMMS